MRLSFFARLTCSVVFATACTAYASWALADQAPADDNVWLTVQISDYPLKPPVQAPADEYFGRQKISNLGMRNIVHDMTIEGTSPLALPKQMGRIVALEDALSQYAERYPADRWLPGQIYWFARFLQTKEQPFADDLALGYYMYLAQRFPYARVGRQAALELTRYQETPPFDMSEIAPPDPHDGVGAFLFPGLK